MEVKTVSEEAVTIVKELFWRRGYDRTSMEEVVAATGLNRYALYNVFGGKRDLFLASLAAYFGERKALFFNTLERSSDDPMNAISTVFHFCIKEISKRGAGCLMCDVGAEVGKTDPGVAAQIDQYLTMIKNAHFAALSRAADLGQLNPSITPSQAAQLLETFLLGLGSQSRRGATEKEMIGVFKSLIATIGKPVELSNEIVEYRNSM